MKISRVRGTFSLRVVMTALLVFSLAIVVACSGDDDDEYWDEEFEAPTTTSQPTQPNTDSSGGDDATIADSGPGAGQVRTAVDQTGFKIQAS